MKPRSRGSVLLRCGDPDVAPIIDNGYFTHSDGMPRFIHAVRVVEQLARTPPLSSLILKQVYPDPATTQTSSDTEDQ